MTLVRLALGLLLAGLTATSAHASGAPRLTNVTLSASGLSLGWTPAGTGLVYTVEWRDRLGDGLWLQAPTTEGPWPIALTRWLDRRPAAPGGRFYRVRAVPTAERGQVLSSVLVRSMSTFEVGVLLAGAGIPIVPQYSLRLHKVVYETIDPHGGRTRASGALVLPQNPGRAVPLLSYQHGTIIRTNEAPSALTGGDLLLGVAYGTTGYAVAMPDYLGLGESPGLHPYHHARSQATAGLDLLRAARTVCAGAGLALNSQLFLCGYSQGGHATLALHRELEAFHTNEFRITASAPMAGAYDLSGVTTDDFLSGRPMPNPYYFAYLLAAYQEVYRLADSLADLLAPPYDQTLPPLLNGATSGGTINAAMPADVTQILKPGILAAFRTDPEHPLRLALRDNDLYAWTPRAPTRLYHCSGDLDVIFANSQVAWNSFQSRGVTDISLINPLPGGDHGACVAPSFLGSKIWFDALKQ